MARTPQSEPHLKAFILIVYAFIMFVLSAQFWLEYELVCITFSACVWQNYLSVLVQFSTTLFYYVPTYIGLVLSGIQWATNFSRISCHCMASILCLVFHLKSHIHNSWHMTYTHTNTKKYKTCDSYTGLFLLQNLQVSVCCLIRVQPRCTRRGCSVCGGWGVSVTISNFRL